MAKHLYNCIMHRIEFLEQLCLIKSFQEALSVDCAKHQHTHQKMLVHEKQSLELLLANSADEATRIQFHLLSLRVFHRWDSRFRKRCLCKGKLSEIVGTYLEFFEFIQESKVSRYIARRCLAEPYEKIPLLLMLANMVFAVLRVKTQTLLSCLKTTARKVTDTPTQNSILLIPQQPAKQRANSLAIRSPSKVSSANPASPTLSRKNTQAAKMPRRSSRAYTENAEEYGTKLNVKGRSVTEQGLRRQFETHFRSEFSRIVSCLPKELDLDLEVGTDSLESVEDKVKGLWLRRNYEGLFYCMMEGNTQIKYTTLRYRKEYRKFLKGKRACSQS